MLASILLIVLGILAVPSLILSKKPNAKELLDKLAPYQGWLGVIFFIWGVVGIFGVIGLLGYLGQGIFGIVLWILNLAIVLVELLLGFLMGYGLIAKYALSKNETAKAKGEEMLAKLAPLQGKLGIAAIIIGILAIVFNILYTAMYVAAVAVA